jgi:hypothetical protein
MKDDGCWLRMAVSCVAIDRGLLVERREGLAGDASRPFLSWHAGGIAANATVFNELCWRQYCFAFEQS